MTDIAISSPSPRFELVGISKAFSGTQANDAIDLSVMPGEIHALLGENGAGKSTLVKIIYGILQADLGLLKWDGKPVRIKNPKEARALGIGMIFQHFSLFDALTVAENIELGMDRPGDRKTIETRIAEIADRYGLSLNPRRHVYTLSAGEKQRVEIVRVLLQDPKLLIMDEPTSVLTPQETEILFETLRRLAAEGRTILYISHKLPEVVALCHAATILRDGKVVAECNPAKESPRSIAELMIGKRLTPPARNGATSAGAARLSVKGLSAPADDQFGVDLYDIALTVNVGEIVGIAGVAGNGQNELMGFLSGERLAPRAEMVVIDGMHAGRLDPNKRRDLSAAFVPEERIGHAAVPEMSLTENALLTGHRRDGIVHFGLIRIRPIRRFAAAVCDAFRVRHAGIRRAAQSLSGGNLQKFLVGREIHHNPGLLVANQPTWGVDSGAAAAIRQSLIDLARNGAAVLLISQDLDELLAVSDRIAVLHAGRLSAARPASELDINEIGLLMTGHELGQPDAERPAA